MPPWLGVAISIPTSTLLFWALAAFFVDPSEADLRAVVLFACVGLFFPGTVALLNFESNRLMGPTIAGALSSIWLMALPLAASAIRGLIQPIVKFGFEWWPNPMAAVVVGYAVSSAVLILSALVRAGGTIPEIDHRGALWFAAVGLCNGLSVLAMYGALAYGPVAIVSPLIAGYPLVTLLLSRAFLRREDIGPQLIAGVIGAVGGVVLLLVA